jgi:uncharacterized protein YgiM (DUF1202 family)
MLKRILAFTIALLMAASMAACKPNDETPEQPGPGTDAPGTTDPGITGPGTDNPGTTEPDPNNPGTDDPGPTDPDAGMTAVSEEVYATVTVDLRTAPEVDANNVAGVLRYGQRATRIKVGEVWSKIVYNEMQYYVASNCLKVYDESVVLPGDEPVVDPSVPLAAGEVLCCTGDGVNLRSEPSKDAASLGKIGIGAMLTFVRVAEEDSEWFLVKNGETECYVSAKYMYKIGKYETLAAPQTRYVTANALTVRYFPNDSEYKEVSKSGIYLGKGDAVTCIAISENNSWAMIELQGKTYFVGNTYLTEVNPSVDQPDAQG